MTEARCFRGVRLPSVPVFGQTVDVWLTPNDHEVRRRSVIGAGALSEDMIRALLPIPVDARVPIASVGADLLILLDEALDVGAAEIIDDNVVRRAVPPITLQGFAKLIHEWVEAQSLTFLRTHAPRLAVAERPLAARILREIEPDVGVAVMGCDDQQILRPPGKRWVRPSWQQWAIAEVAFNAWAR